MDSAEEFARLKGETLEPHEGYYRTNSGAWIVTANETDEDGYQVGGPVAEVTFKGTAKRGEAYKAPDPVGQANARLIAAAPDMFEALDELLNYSGGADSALEDEYVVARAIAALAKARGRQP
jgi:hypothetical protein